MIIAIDESIPYWEQAFKGLGELRPFRGRALRPGDLQDVNALVVRSITRVDASLLDGSPVRFVGTATIGMDHLDLDWLRSRGIYFTNAAGSNANAVAEYVTTALLVIASRRGWDLGRKTCAIIGVGNVGSRVEAKVRTLGMNVLLCDPPLGDRTGNAKYLHLRDILDADILTLHVPLTTAGPYPTRHMINQRILDAMPEGRYILNSSRGSVIEPSALKRALITGKLEGAVLDVWEGEPVIDYELLERVDIGTPHIAGFSLDGKVKATEMIVDELCSAFSLPGIWNSAGIYPPVAEIRTAGAGIATEALRSACLQAYNILRDDANLRALAGLDKELSAVCFDQLRNGYPLRPEFNHFSVKLGPEEQQLAEVLGALGFGTMLTGRTEGGA